MLLAPRAKNAQTSAVMRGRHISQIDGEGMQTWQPILIRPNQVADLFFSSNSINKS